MEQTDQELGELLEVMCVLADDLSDKIVQSKLEQCLERLKLLLEKRNRQHSYQVSVTQDMGYVNQMAHFSVRVNGSPREALVNAVNGERSVVELRRFELLTLWLQTRCSTN